MVSLSPSGSQDVLTLARATSQAPLPKSLRRLTALRGSRWPPAGARPVSSAHQQKALSVFTRHSGHGAHGSGSPRCNRKISPACSRRDSLGDLGPRPRSVLSPSGRKRVAFPRGSTCSCPGGPAARAPLPLHVGREEAKRGSAEHEHGARSRSIRQQGGRGLTEAWRVNGWATPRGSREISSCSSDPRAR